MDSLWKEHCSDTNDHVALILKCHLIIEKYLDDILTLCLPEPNKILKNSSFSTKVKLFESLNISRDTKIIKKIKTINMLRNWLAHNLDKDLTDKEQRRLCDGLGLKPKEIKKKLYGTIWGIIGYLHAKKDTEERFPFISNYRRNESRLKKDKGFAYFGLIIKMLLPEYKEILRNLKM